MGDGIRVGDVAGAMEGIAPTGLAEAWDNVGLLVGVGGSAVRSVLLCIDYTRAVAAEAVERGCGMVIAYHPPIFKAMKRVLAGGVVYGAIRDGVAIYSPHTALDVAEGGTNDVLADAVGLEKRRPLRVVAGKETRCKLVTFAPREAAGKVAEAMFAAGAGRIGGYSKCSFRSEGQGTFEGGEGTNPAVGEAGRFELADEARIETVVDLADVEAVVGALRSAHPYERPAFDLVRLAAEPTGMGLGRIGSMAAVERGEVLRRIKAALGTERLLVAGPVEGRIGTAAVCAGSCGERVDDALGTGAELYLTGEMRHHDALRAAEAGMTVVCALHSVSERAVLRRVADRLKAALPGLEAIVSRRDRDPFAIL